MQVIPAIDLRGGLCVRLRQGDFDQETVFGDDPAAMAARWESEGAARIHLVDLDGAKAGRPVNVEAVGGSSRSVGVPCQLGGGVRDEATIAAWLEAGIERVVVGTQALRDPGMVRPDGRGLSRPAAPGAGCAGRPGRHRGLARDSRASPRWPWPGSSTPCRWPASIYTDIARDGTLEGPNLERDRRAGRGRADAGDRLGRGRELEDLERLAELPIAGCIVGRGLVRRPIHPSLEP